MARAKLTGADKGIVTTVQRYGVTCYRRWGKSAWEPRKRAKRAEVNGNGAAPSETHPVAATGTALKVYVYQCKRCQHEWPSRLARPHICPKCKSPYYDTPRTRPVKKRC